MNKRHVTTKELRVTDEVSKILKERYIAFDVETTGLSRYKDRIVELGAVVFENGVPVKRYGTLVNAHKEISPGASRVNHITNDMIQNAPSEIEVYESLIDFLGDALQEKTIICAHNAKFDMGFLSETLKRLGYEGHIYYVDTLSLSRSLIYEVMNYQQGTVAEYFGLYNEHAHRAQSDAEICGCILWKLLDMRDRKYQDMYLY